MIRHFEKEISGHGAYFHALFGLLLAWSNKIRFTRAYFCPCLMFRRMHSHYENKISSDGAYCHALFGLLLAWSIIIKSTIYYFYPCLNLRRMHSYLVK